MVMLRSLQIWRPCRRDVCSTFLGSLVWWRFRYHQIYNDLYSIYFVIPAGQLGLWVNPFLCLLHVLFYSQISIFWGVGCFSRNIFCWVLWPVELGRNHLLIFLTCDPPILASADRRHVNSVLLCHKLHLMVPAKLWVLQMFDTCTQYCTWILTTIAHLKFGWFESLESLWKWFESLWL